jgi:hypothetical protein
MGVRTIRLVVEDCASLHECEFLPAEVHSVFALVRHAPEAWCPDRVDQIPWEVTPSAGARTLPWSAAHPRGWPQAV